MRGFLYWTAVDDTEMKKPRDLEVRSRFAHGQPLAPAFHNILEQNHLFLSCSLLLSFQLPYPGRVHVLKGDKSASWQALTVRLSCFHGHRTELIARARASFLRCHYIEQLPFRLPRTRTVSRWSCTTRSRFRTQGSAWPKPLNSTTHDQIVLARVADSEPSIVS